MEGGRVDEGEVVDGEVRRGDNADQARAVGALARELVAVALHGALRGLREELEVVGVLHDDHVPARSAGAVDDPVELQRPAGAAIQGLPCGHRVVSWRNVHFDVLGSDGVSRWDFDIPMPPLLHAAKALASGGPRSVDLSALAP